MRIAALVGPALIIGAAASIAAADPKPQVETETRTYSFSSGQGQLGVAVLGLTDSLKTFFGAGKDGVLVGTVVPGSAAERAGVQVGDVITKFEGAPVDDVGDLRRAMSGKHKGEHLAIEAIRDHRAVELTAELRADAPTYELHSMRDLPNMPDIPDMLGDGEQSMQKWMQHIETEMKEMREHMPQQPQPKGSQQSS